VKINRPVPDYCVGYVQEFSGTEHTLKKTFKQSSTKNDEHNRLFSKVMKNHNLFSSPLQLLKSLVSNTGSSFLKKIIRHVLTGFMFHRAMIHILIAHILIAHILIVHILIVHILIVSILIVSILIAHVLIMGTLLAMELLVVHVLSILHIIA
jgi:CBS domain containing-hemolysin-like protein